MKTHQLSNSNLCKPVGKIGGISNNKNNLDNVLQETAAVTLNLATARFIKKIAHEATMYSLQEAKKNSQQKLPLHVEYEHLSGMFREKIIESEKENNRKLEGVKRNNTKSKGKRSKKIEEGNHFSRTMSKLFPEPVSLDKLVKAKDVQIANIAK